MEGGVAPTPLMYVALAATLSKEETVRHPVGTSSKDVWPVQPGAPQVCRLDGKSGATIHPKRS